MNQGKWKKALREFKDWKLAPLTSKHRAIYTLLSTADKDTRLLLGQLYGYQATAFMAWHCAKDQDTFMANIDYLEG